MAKRVTVQIKLNIFDPFHPVSIFGFALYFKIDCDANDIHEGATSCLLDFLMRKSASNVINRRFASKLNAQTRMLSLRKTTTLSTYPQVVNYKLTACQYVDHVVEKSGKFLSVA